MTECRHYSSPEPLDFSSHSIIFPRDPIELVKKLSPCKGVDGTNLPSTSADSAGPSHSGAGSASMTALRNTNTSDLSVQRTNDDAQVSKL